MKKRKPPIVAITILLVCFAVAVGFNYKAGINPKAVPTEEAQAPASEVHVGAVRPSSSATDVAKAVKQQAGGAGETAPKPEAGPHKGPRQMGGAMSGPTIALPKLGATKPVPNESAVSSQWYQSSSSKSGN